LVSYKNPIEAEILTLRSFQTARKFEAEKGILSSTTVKLGKGLLLATADTGKQFYASNEIIRIEDFVSVNSEGKEVHLQK
jgi:hypothetical protein